MSPHSNGQPIQSRPQQSHCSTLRKTVSDPGLRRSRAKDCAPEDRTRPGTRRGPCSFLRRCSSRTMVTPKMRNPAPRSRPNRVSGVNPPNKKSTDGHEHQCGADDEQRPFPPQPCLHSCGSAEASRTYCSRTPHHSPRTAPPCTAGSPWVGAPTGWTGTGGQDTSCGGANRPGLGSGASRSTRSSTIAATAGRCLTRRGDPARCGPERGIVSPR